MSDLVYSFSEARSIKRRGSLRMPFVSHAQNYEDVLLWRALKDVDRGFYVDVGAYSPSSDSVTRAFYDRGWHGINIEPNPGQYLHFESARPRDINLMIAVGDEPGTGVLNVFENAGLSTLDNNVANMHCARGESATQVDVRTDTLENILSTHVPEGQIIHFMKIDVEGFEEEALKSAAFSKHRPWIVLIEATIPMSPEIAHTGWEDHLLDRGYSFVYFDGLNRFYVSNEKKSALSDKFKLPPNVFDDFITHREAELLAIQSTWAWRMSQPLRWLHRRKRSMVRRWSR